MKNILKSTVFAVTAVLAGCSTDTLSDIAENNQKFNIKIHAGFPQTRTAFGDKNEETNSYPVFWDDNDSFAIVEHIAGVQSQVVQAYAENISDDRKSAEIFAELSIKRGSSFDYYAYSPYEAYSEGKMIIPAAQTPSATSVDPSAMLLFASKEGLTAQTPELDLSFGHIAAYARMTVEGLTGAAEDIVSVTFSTDADLAGTVDVESGTVTNGSKSVTLDVSSLGYTTADKFDIWFTAAPQENISKFTVGIATKKAEYSKDFTISGGKLLAFKQGRVSSFTVDMSGAESNDGTIYKIYVETKGSLEDIIIEKGIDVTIIEELHISGHLNIFDYSYINSLKNLKTLDLSELEDTTMPTGCFRNSTIETVILPKNLTAIPDSAFYKAEITSITIPETVQTIGDSAFYDCQKAKGNLIIPEATISIGEYAFQYCYSLNGELVIPDSVVSIGWATFSNCTGFESLKIGKGLTEIPNYCFDGCTGFTGKLTIPEGITSIGRYAFYNCSGFTGSLIIPDSVTDIYDSAFRNCSGFNSYLSIGSGVTEIGDNAFSSTKFPRVYCNAITPPSISYSNYYYHTFYDATTDYLGVPVGCRSAYNNSNWGYTFKTIEEVELD